MPQNLSRSSPENSTDLDTQMRTIKIGEDTPIRISSGHRILNHEGKCSRPHGHNYEITVSVTGVVSEDGFVVDKGDVTSIINEWDHMFLVEKGDPLVEALEAAGDGDSLVVLEHPPTAEVMSILFEKRMLEAFPETVTDVSVTVRETGELCASY